VATILASVQQLVYVIVLCENIERMKAFYRKLSTFPVESESETTLSLRAGSLLLALRKRTRDYDGRDGGAQFTGVQLAFRVSRDDVEIGR